MWTIITTLLGGGLTGLIGSLVTSILTYKSKQADRAHELALIEANSNATIREVEANIKITESQVAGDIAKAEMTALQDTYKDQAITLFDKSYMGFLAGSKIGTFFAAIISFAFAMADFLSKTVRPVLTYYTLGISTYLTLLCYQLIQTKGMQSISPESAVALFDKSTNALFYLTVTAATWWFCDRKFEKQMTRSN